MAELSSANQEAVDTFMQTFEKVMSDYTNVMCNYSILVKMQAMVANGRIQTEEEKRVVDVTLALLADDPLALSDSILRRTELYVAIINMNDKDKAEAGEG